MNIHPKIHNTLLPQAKRVGYSILGLSILSSVNYLAAEIIFETGFEDLATGTLSETTHPGWEGMLEGNQGEQDPSDWEIEEGAGLTWVAPDGGTIDGGNKHFDMRAISNITGRAFYNFENPLPTDTGAATSIYLRWVASFDQFEWISQTSTGPDDPRSVWPVIRFNSSWQMRSVLKWREYETADNTELGFMFELHDDKDLASGTRSIVRLEDKLGEPQPMTPYLVITRYDFDSIGVLQGQAAWVNPNFADKDTPDLVSNHEQPGYDTFVNPIVSMDITTYGGTVRYDNIMIADSWEDVVPEPGNLWAGYTIDANGDVDTGDWLGWLNVNNDPWIYSYALENWLYLPEDNATDSGGWVYAVK